MQVPIEIDVYGEMIRGILHIPNHFQGRPKVYIMCYGYNGDMCEVNRLTRKIGMECEGKGIFFVRFDYRGHGISDGKTSEILLNTKVDDVVYVMNFIKGCLGNDDCDFYLIGFSDGGKIALDVAKQQKVKKVILWNPILNMATISNLYNHQHGKVRKVYKEPKTGKRVVSLFGLGINVMYLNEIMKRNMENDLLDTELNILCIWGEEDRYTRQLREKCLNGHNMNIENIVINGAKHLFGDEIQQKKLIYYTLDEVKTCD